MYYVSENDHQCCDHVGMYSVQNYIYSYRYESLFIHLNKELLANQNAGGVGNI